jgi:two-component system response regulator FixJ
VTHAFDQQVLLIDEDEVVRDSLKVLLESHGVQVRDFRSAAEFMATGKMARGGCLVLGYNRLIVDGLELIATLRRRGIVLPGIFIVGGGNALTKAAALAAGAFAYLERPIEETALIRAIKAALIGENGRADAGQTASPMAELPIASVAARS